MAAPSSLHLGDGDPIVDVLMGTVSRRSVRGAYHLPEAGHPNASVSTKHSPIFVTSPAYSEAGLNPPWFGQHDARGCQLALPSVQHANSDNSELALTPTPCIFLAPPGPKSVQHDIQSVSSWAINKAESTVGSAFFSAGSVAVGTDYCLDDTAHDLGASSKFDSLEELLPPVSLNSIREDHLNYLSPTEPWCPGARSLRQGVATAAANYVPSFHFGNKNPSNETNSPLLPYYKDTDDSDTILTSDSIISGTAVSFNANRSSYSDTTHVSSTKKGDITVCNYCSVEFTGRYQGGNCARHIRQQHSGKFSRSTSDCVCRVCQKTFKRQDARRKHEWKKHKLSGTKPRSRRLDASSVDDQSHADTSEFEIERSTVASTTVPLAECHQSESELHYDVPSQPARAQVFFRQVKERLDEKSFQIVCREFLAIAQHIVRHLHEKRHHLHDVYAHVVNGLNNQMLSAARYASRMKVIDEDMLVDTEYDAYRADRSIERRKNHGKARADRPSSSTPSRYSPYSGLPAKRSKADPITTIAEQFELPASKDLDCPVYKWHRIHAREAPCNGCGKPFMNGVRQHLLPNYSQQHEGYISFIQRCSNCKKDIIDVVEWDSGGHRTSTCEGRSQGQGNNLICWARLYLKIYPDETEVPSPYRNDHRLLPNSLVHLLRQESQSFRPEMPSPVVASADQHGMGARSNFIQGPDASNIELFRWLERELEEKVSLEVLIARATRLLENLKAQRQLGAAAEPLDAQDIEVEHRRIANLLRPIESSHHGNRARINRPETLTTSYTVPNMPSQQESPGLQEPQDPFLGSADFEMPDFTHSQYPGGTPFKDSDTTTQPSMNYLANCPSTHMPSINASSQTSHDNDNYMLYDLDQDRPAYSPTASDQSLCPPSVYFPEIQPPHSPWPDPDSGINTQTPLAVLVEDTNPPSTMAWYKDEIQWSDLD